MRGPFQPFNFTRSWAPRWPRRRWAIRSSRTTSRPAAQPFIVSAPWKASSTGRPDRLPAFDLEAEERLRAARADDDGAAIEAAIAALLEIGLGAGDEADRPALEFVGRVGGEALRLLEIVGDAADLRVDAATVAQTAGHQVDGERLDIDAEPAAPEGLGGFDGRAAAAEGIEDEVASLLLARMMRSRRASGFGWGSRGVLWPTLAALISAPNTLIMNAFHFIQILLQIWHP